MTRQRVTRPILIAAAVLIALMAVTRLLLLSAMPIIAAQPRPSVGDVQAAREVLDQVRGARDAGRGEAVVRLDNRKLSGLVALAGDALEIERLDARIAAGALTGTASLELPLGYWTNASVTVRGRHAGFPRMEVRLGRLRLPDWAGELLARGLRLGLRWRGIDVPPLDTLVRGMTVEQQHVAARIALPREGSVAQNLARLRTAPMDDRVVARTYCSLQHEQRRLPAIELAMQVRRAFRGSGGDEPDRDNRARFVALAMFLVPEQTQHLAAFAPQLIAACGAPDDSVLLAGRRDLAKHWSLSAALAAMFGTDAAGAMGEWKELADSTHGSGFSFVDLAADRSGTHVARRATDADTAAAARARLAHVTERQIFPLPLLAGREGMTDAQFVGRYRAIDARGYRMAVARIDRALQRADLP